MDARLIYCGSCTTHSQERKIAEGKLYVAKPNTLTEHEHVVHDSKICVTVRNNDDVINIGEYNIDAGEWVQDEPKIASILDPENIDDDTTRSQALLPQ